jgi:probable HAF family extracellular repeat protein
MTDLGTLGGKSSVAYAISPSGLVVGSSFTRDGLSHAFLWQNGVMTDLGSLGGTSHAQAVNRAGWVVGGSETKSGNVHATLWKPI